MSDQDTNPEDHTILTLLDALDRGVRDSRELPVVRTDDSTETLTRLYIEVLGLMPCDLSPVTPRPEVKERLMAAIAGSGGAAGTGAAARPAAPVLPFRPSQEVPVQRPVAVPPPAGRPRRWPLAVAATIAFLAVGLSAVLFYGMLEQGRKIEELTREKNAAIERAERAAATTGPSDRAYAEMVRMREQMALITSPAVEVSPLRAVGDQPQARGILFVHANHQHWYLSLQGLEPAPAGKAYKLWFMADRPIAAGAFTAEPGAAVEMGSKTMPAGTTGAVITLEDDPQATAPAGPEVLRAVGVYQMS